MKMMKHFSLEEWVDFARGAILEQRQIEMRQHLETGCADCGSAFRTWTRVHQIGRADSGYEPPDVVLRTVKGNFAIHGPQIKGRIPVVTRLLFDSLSSALPVGIRSGEASARQLLYEVGAYELDLRLEPQYDSPEVLLVGQLSCRDSDHSVDKALVALVAGDATLAESVTSPLGEFSLQCRVKGSFQLRFDPVQEIGFYVPVADPRVPDRLSSADETVMSRRSPAKRQTKKE
jgi:hypothetical protein